MLAAAELVHMYNAVLACVRHYISFNWETMEGGTFFCSESRYVGGEGVKTSHFQTGSRLTAGRSLDGVYSSPCPWPLTLLKTSLKAEGAKLGSRSKCG